MPRLLATALASLILFTFTTAAQALDCTWNPSAVGNWNNAANWDCGDVPNGDDDVTISSGTVTITQNHTVQSFTMTGSGAVAGAAFTITVTGTMAWNSGTMGANLTLATAGPCSS